MIKKFAFVILALALSAHAHAGIMDFLLGGDDKEESEAVVDTGASPPEPELKSGTAALLDSGMALLPLLRESLKISEAQASGGLGALLQAARSLLAAGDFSVLTDAIPGATALLGAAPSVARETEASSALDDALNMAAEHSETAKSAAGLVAQFKALELKPDMIPKFTDITAAYLQKHNAEQASDILMSSLGSLF